MILGSSYLLFSFFIEYDPLTDGDGDRPRWQDNQMMDRRLQVQEVMKVLRVMEVLLAWNTAINCFLKQDW